MRKIYTCNFRLPNGYHWVSLIVTNKKAAKKWLRTYAADFCKNSDTTAYITEEIAFNEMPF